MISNRNDIYLALFELISTTPGFSSFYRTFPTIQQLTGMKLPALCMRQKTEVVHANFAMPPKYSISIELCIVAATPRPTSDSIPAEILNPLVDAVENVLSPGFVSLGVNSLGQPNVSRCWIEGKIDFYEAVADTNQSMVFIPVMITAV